MNYLRRELFILRSFFTLLKRDFKKYFTVAGLTYFLGATRLYRSAKPAYFFCRYVDDLADGDRELPANISFKSFIARLIYLVEFPDTKNTDNLGLVLTDAMKKLNRLAPNPKVVAAEFKDFLKSMLKDYNRRIDRKTLSQSEINELYDQSFASVLHLALIGFGTHLERSQLHKLGLLQGKVYALQDMEEELSRGIINVPQQVLTEADLTVKAVVNSPHSLINSLPYQQWHAAELNECQTLTHALLNLEAEKKAMKMIRVLVLPLGRFLSAQNMPNPAVAAAMS